MSEDDRSRLGWFWLPDHPEDRLPGRFDFDETSVGLELLGGFAAHRPSSGRVLEVTTPVIHGEVANPPQLVSIFGCRLLFPTIGGWSSYHANAVLYSRSDSAGSIDISALSFDLTGLDWAFGRPTHVADRGAAGGTFTVSDVGSGVAECDLGNGFRFTIRSSVWIGFHPDVVFRPTYRCTLAAENPRELDEFLNTARAVRALVEILTDAGQRVSGFVCTEPDGTENGFRFPTVELRPPGATGETTAPPSILLSTRELVPANGTDDDWAHALALVFQGWPSWRHTYIEAVDNLSIRVREDASNARERFRHAASALERYGRERHGSTVSDEEHAARVERVLDALPDELPEKEWVRSALPSRNGKGFRRVIEEVAAPIPGVVHVVPDLGAFAKGITKRRGARSHGDVGRTRDEEKMLDRRARALLLLAYMEECNRAADDIERVASIMSSRL